MTSLKFFQDPPKNLSSTPNVSNDCMKAFFSAGVIGSSPDVDGSGMGKSESSASKSNAGLAAWNERKGVDAGDMSEQYLRSKK